MKKKILIISDLDMKRFDSTTEFMAAFLEQCRARDYEVEYMVPTEPSEPVKEKLRPVKFVYTVIDSWWGRKDRAKRNTVSVAFRLFGLIRDRNADLVAYNYCGEITAIIIGILAKLTFMKTCFIWHEHGELRRTWANCPLRKHVSQMQVLSLLLDRICPVAESQGALLAERGVPRKKIRVMHNGINVRRFAAAGDRTTLLRRLGIRAPGHIVTTVATLTEGKGIGFLLAAAKNILELFPCTVFLIAGDGPLAGRLKKLSEDYGIAAAVRFLGTRSDIHDILAVSDVFVLPSLSEAFGLVNIEAMASGKPVVATRVGGIPEAVRDGVSGCLVPPGNAAALAKYIALLLGNKGLREGMGKAGRKIVEEKYSIEKMTDRYLRLYEDVMAGDGPVQHNGCADRPARIGAKVYDWIARRRENLAVEGLITVFCAKPFLRSIYDANMSGGHRLREGRKPALTISFDCDYPKDVEAIPVVLKSLGRYGIKASFACVGHWIEKYPLQHRLLLDEGHELVNHTYSHPDNELLNPGRKFREISREEKKEEITRCHEICSRLLRYEPAGCRIPHFKHLFTSEIYSILKELGYRYSSSTWLTNTTSYGMPFEAEEGIMEFPLTTCPEHPFSVFDTWHSFNSPRLLYRLGHRSEERYAALFKYLVDLAAETGSYMNIYIDPADVLKMKDFDDLLAYVREKDIRVSRYEDLLPPAATALQAGQQQRCKLQAAGLTI